MWNIKQNLLKAACTALVLGAGVSSWNPDVWANEPVTSFTDVPQDHWAWKNHTIQWALSNHIISGYPDGTFKPNNNVTEEEFLSMLLHFFPNANDALAKLGSSADSATTPDELYQAAKQFHLPVSGDATADLRSKAITRGEVARLLAAANGKNYNTEGAIAYLYDKGISKGKTKKTIDGYDSEGSITRVECIQLLKVMHDKGLDAHMEISPSVEEINPDVALYKTTSIESIQQNMEQAKQFYSPSPEDGISQSTLDFWADQLYSLAKKSGAFNDKVRIYLPQVQDNQSIVYHVITDKWYEGEEKGKAAPGYIEFPLANKWNFELIVKQRSHIVGSVYYDTTAKEIDVDNILIEKTEE
ncbi:S-layer homology domain-containing protein [Aneurinibacillus terranovensis]|uniref:S-layer homology domain-containing protein n=1 Tax=Aneurinibacillus terranovensis TaxID=278991 RepID=UPI00041B6625|nr:S-layer homology domain-containing protein [Aneurinibacillus terranovensis]